MHSMKLLLVDWCRSSLVGPPAIGEYLAATGAVGRN